MSVKRFSERLSLCLRLNCLVTLPMEVVEGSVGYTIRTLQFGKPLILAEVRYCAGPGGSPDLCSQVFSRFQENFRIVICYIQLFNESAQTFTAVIMAFCNHDNGKVPVNFLGGTLPLRGSTSAAVHSAEAGLRHRQNRWNGSSIHKIKKEKDMEIWIEWPFVPQVLSVVMEMDFLVLLRDILEPLLVESKWRRHGNRQHQEHGNFPDVLDFLLATGVWHVLFYILGYTSEMETPSREQSLEPFCRVEHLEIRSPGCKYLPVQQHFVQEQENAVIHTLTSTSSDSNDVLAGGTSVRSILSKNLSDLQSDGRSKWTIAYSFSLEWGFREQGELPDRRNNHTDLSMFSGTQTEDTRPPCYGDRKDLSCSSRIASKLPCYKVGAHMGSGASQRLWCVVQSAWERQIVLQKEITLAEKSLLRSGLGDMRQASKPNVQR
ncbi:hypothetical protein BTVI_86674 [Pitangus sulphuratus]|nr:hypothetical protein BTVI_86674 [Pitangus sulphuratus]